jgi:hypothetical protein
LLSFFKICLDVATAFFQCSVKWGTDGLFLHVEKERKAYVLKGSLQKRTLTLVRFFHFSSFVKETENNNFRHQRIDDIFR